MYNNLGDVNFNGKFKGIPLKANQINDSLIEIVVDNKKVSFKKGKKNIVKKELQTIFNKILTKQYKDLDDKYLESDAKKDNIKINKFVDSLDLEFKNIQIMPVKKKVTKKAVTKKAVAPRKKITVKKVVAPLKKVVRRNIEIDSNRPALPKGKRISKNDNVYYEYRENHADNKQTKKKGQMLGMAKITGLPMPDDEQAIREIELYAINDAKLYHSQRLPILKNLYKKYKKNTYDVEKASKLYRIFIDNAMKLYNKEFGSKGDKWYDLLSTNDRQILAKEFALETLRDFKNGEFNDYDLVELIRYNK